MRSHGSGRLCRSGAGTAAGRTPAPLPVTVSGSTGLLTQLTAKQGIPAPPGLEQQVVITRQYTQALRFKRDQGPLGAVNGAANMSSRVAQCLVSLVFRPFASASGNVLGGLPGEQRDRRTGRFASVIALAPAGWVRTSGQRSWSRCSVSLSPRGNTTFRYALSCTSGSSSTASTRLARRPGAMCPDSARSDAQAVPPGPWEVTSAAATVHVWSLISTCRCSSRPTVPAARPRQGGLAGGSVLARSGTVRSHESWRSSGSGAETAAGRAAGPIPVTVPGLLGLLTDLTPGR